MVEVPLLMDLLGKTLKDLTKFLADTYCPESLFKCNISSFSYEVSYEDAKEMKIIPPVDDIGDVKLTLYAVGGYSGGPLLSINIEGISDIEMSLDDRDMIIEKINDKVTLRDFLRMSYTFAWRYEKNKFMRITGRAKNGETIEKLMKNVMNLGVVPEPDVTVLITKHFDELDEVRYEVDVIRIPLIITIRNTANATLTDIVDAFKFGYAPLWAP